jgi:hypothetical protein
MTSTVSQIKTFLPEDIKQRYYVNDLDDEDVFLNHLLLFSPSRCRFCFPYISNWGTRFSIMKCTCEKMYLDLLFSKRMISGANKRKLRDSETK